MRAPRVGGMFLMLVAATSSGCSRTDSLLESVVGQISDSVGQTARDPATFIVQADPPYTSSVLYPSGLRLADLVEDAQLTGMYPSASGGGFPFGANRTVHYRPVGYFIDIPSLSADLRAQQVAENFTLQEYVWIPERNGDQHIYVDAEIAFHTQELRSGWGAPLVLTSTYRSPEYNASIGGAFFSRHMYGDAVDVKAPSRETAQDLYNLARFLDVGFLEPASRTIVGRNTPWIHIDDRGWPVNTAETR